MNRVKNVGLVIFGFVLTLFIQDVAAQQRVICVSGCGTATTDTDDGSIAASQSVGLSGSLTHIFDGTAWRRLFAVDLDTGAGTEHAAAVSLRIGASGGSIPLTAGAGAVAAGTLRFTLASDDPGVASLSVLDDWDDGSDRARVVGAAAHDAAAAGNPVSVGATANSSAPTAVAAGDAVRLWSFLNGQLAVTLVNSSGTELTSGDATHDSGVSATGPQVALEAKDFDGAALPNVVSVEGDAVRSAGSLYGITYTMPVGEDGSITPLQAEDAAETAGGGLMMAGAVRRDTAAVSSGTAGDNSTINVDALGQVWTRHNNPCTGNALTTDPFSITTDTVIIAAAASKKNYICGITIVAGAAEIVSITEGTGAVCATSEAALVGSTTDANGMSFAANGGVSTNATIAGKTANVDTCLNVSGTNRVSGFVTWVQQ